jgi:DUF438 domain-containing protein
MMLSEIREELLAQHGRLRALAIEALASAEQARAGGEAGWTALVDALARLGRASAEHIRREEELLGLVLPTIDAWGARRAALMDERHRDEHQAITEALTLARTQKSRPEVLRLVGDAVRALREHMQREEQEILHEDVLRDDIFTIDSAGG